MGKLTLLFVLSAVVGGSILTLSTRSTLGAGDEARAEDQADVLARQIAESGRGLALTRMVGPGGFTGFQDAGEYDGGQYTIDVQAASSETATVTVTGSYGGAVHTLRSTHRYDPMDAPGPLWLDVPYATGTAVDQPEISGGPSGGAVLVDTRKHADLDLGGFLPLSGLTASVGTMARSSKSSLTVPAADEWAAADGLLEDLNVEDTDGLYEVAVGVFADPNRRNASDRRMAGNQTVTAATTWGGTSAVTFVDGDLTVAPSGSVTGTGALVVGGALRVQASAGRRGRLNWSGLVIVRSTKDVLPVELDGDVRVSGAVAVAHTAFPPGGHLDVSVYRDRDGMKSSHGDLKGANTQWGWRPWFEHTHRFDQTPETRPRGTHVYYLEGGRAGRHEAETEFADFLKGLDPKTPVYLEFANAEKHGFSRYRAELSGLAAPLTGSVRDGFPLEFRHPTSDTRSAEFEVGRLRGLDVEVRSLRALMPMFNVPGSPCSDWPVCIGNDWNRLGSLALRLKRASDGKRLYESTLYWHMKGDEVRQHQLAEQAWRARIAAGADFGTHLRLSGGVRLTYARAPIAALAGRLGFDGDEVRLVETSSHHVTTAEAQAQQDASQAPAGGGKVWVCHVSGRSRSSKQVPTSALPSHLAHGDTPGQCGAPSGETTGGVETGDVPAAPAPAPKPPKKDPYTDRSKPPSTFCDDDWEWEDGRWECD